MVGGWVKKGDMECKKEDTYEGLMKVDMKVDMRKENEYDIIVGSINQSTGQ